jgi:hypothetical protein
MVASLVVWHGDTSKMLALMAAIEHNCTCKSGGGCPAHQALLSQRFIDWLLFLRWQRERECDKRSGRS